MKTNKIKLVLKNLMLRHSFVLFLAILSPSPSHGMNHESDELESDSHKMSLRQNLLVNKSKADESFDSSLKSLIETSSPDQLTEDTLSNESNIISRAYVQAFRDDPDGSSRKLLILKCIASLGGFGAGIPGIASALQAGEYYGSSTLGYYFAASTVLYAGGVAGWTIWELIESSQSPQSSLRLNNDKQLKSRVGKIAGSLVLGALSSTPQVYVAYKYNTIKGIAAVSFVYEWILRSLGFYKFISPIKMKKNIDICELNMIKNKGLECIDQSKVHFLRLHQESNGSELFLPLKNLSSPKELYSYLNSASSQGQALITRTQDVLPYYYAKGVPRKLTQYFALIFPFGGAFVNGVLTYKGFSLITDNTTALVLLTGVSVLPTLVLDSFATKQVAGGIFDAAYSCKSEVLPSDYFELFNPKLKKVIIGGALALALSAAGGGIYVILDNLDGTFLSPSKYAFTALAAVSAIKFGTYAIVNTAMNFGTVLTKQFKKTSAYTFNCLKKLDSLRDLIWESDTTSVENFLNEVGVDSTERPEYYLKKRKISYGVHAMIYYKA